MVGNLYTVPFSSPPPPSVESMAIVISCYRLYRRREVPDEKNKYFQDYTDVMAFLQNVKDGSEVLDLSVSKQVPPVAANQRATIWGYGQNFVPNTM
jgi:phage gp36-like protein